VCIVGFELNNTIHRGKIVMANSCKRAKGKESMYACEGGGIITAMQNING
jgi:hypothetical protein